MTAPRIPLTPVPEDSPEQLDLLAEVGPQHIADADLAWQQAAPSPFKTLLQATEDTAP